MLPWLCQSWLKQLIRSWLFGRCRPIRTRLPRTPRLCLEQLEGRVLPSGSGGAAVPLAVGLHLNLQEYHDPSRIPAGVTPGQSGILPQDNGSPVPTGYTPIQLQTAYGVNNIKFGSIKGDGTGQTIAIVDAYDDPSFVDSTASNFASSDLAQFDATFGLANPPSFKKVNENGQTTNLPGTDPAGAGNSSGNWEVEEALDIEWAHSMAPGASIILVEATTQSDSDLYKAVATAADLPGVSVVSMSWGEDEFSGETADDSTLVTPTGHQGVTFLAASGDSGGYSSNGSTPGIIYPAASPNVISVGGTTLQLNADNTIASETTWSGSGGGTSLYETEPSYQLGVQNTGFRTNPDVASDADPYTGVSVYDSYNDTDNSGPWVTVGGTSLATPSWAGVIAIANQGRVLGGASTLNGPSQTLPYLYALSANDFNDITKGNNGVFSAGPGYDEVTGLGSPRAAALTADLSVYGASTEIVVTSQPPSNLIVGNSFGVVVAAENSFGEVDPAFNGTLKIALAPNSAGATLGGTLTATASHGVAVFDGLTLDQLGTGYTIEVTSSTFASITTNPFDVIPNPTPWQGTYYPVSTDASLRAAINAADSNSFAFNTILLSASTYLLSNTSLGGLVIENTSSLSSKTLTITGQGATSSIIGGVVNWNDRIFEIVGSAGQTLNVTLQDLTIEDGNALTGGVLGGNNALGGGLLIDDAAVTLANDDVENNQAQGAVGTAGNAGAAGGGAGKTGGNANNAKGGGIYLASGTLSLFNDTISGNAARGGVGGQGGAGGGQGTKAGAAVTGGRGGLGGNGGSAAGGGLYAAAGTVVIRNGSFSSNQAVGGPGGQGGTGGSGGHGNGALSGKPGGVGGVGGVGGPAYGGGMYLASGSLTLAGSTLQKNSAVGGAGGQGGVGGGGTVQGASATGVFGGSGSTFGNGSTLGGITGASAVGGPGGKGGVGGAGSLGLGGGVYVASGNLTLVDATLEANQALGGQGGAGGVGGIAGFGVGTTSLGLAAKTAGNGGNGGNGGLGQGGGILVAGGTVVLFADTLNGNSAQGGKGGAGGHGGNGPLASFGSTSFNFGSSSSSFGGSTPFGGGGGGQGANSAGAGGNGGTGNNGYGGGLYVSGGALTLTNTTVADNTAQAGTSGLSGSGGLAGTGILTGGPGTKGSAGACAGGGLYVNGGTVTINNSTVALNLLSGSGSGGGAVVRSPGTVTAVSTLFAGNGTVDYSGSVTATDSLFQTAPTGTLSGSGNHTNVNPLLNTKGLTNNGGPTDTIALQSMSPAIGAGSNPETLSTDQRGYSWGSSTDIGAYQTTAQADTQAPTATLQATTVTNSNASALNPYTFTITYSDNVAVALATLSGAVVQVIPLWTDAPLTATVVSTVAVGTVDGGGNAPSFVVTYQITPPGGAWTPDDDGTYTVTLGGAAITDLQGNAAATGTVGTFTVLTQYATATTISAASGNANPSNYGQSLSFTATVVNTVDPTVTPTGWVSFYNGSTKLATVTLVSGSATYTNATLTAGAYSLTATFNGTTEFATSASDPTRPVLQTIDPDSTATTLTAAPSNPNPSTYGQSLSFTAMVANTSGTGQTPTGSVSFYNGSTKISTVTLVSGSATYTNSTLTAGSYSLTAKYNGSTDFATSSSDPTTPILQTINADNTTTTISAASGNPSPSIYGQSLSFTATVANTSATGGTPTGSVSFYNGMTKIATVSLVSGSATYTNATLTADSYSLTAKYNGTTDFATSSSDPTTPILQTINAATTTTTISAASGNSSPSIYGQSLSFIATVANTSGTGQTPTGSVSFYNGTTKIATVSLVSGSATYTSATLTVGSNSLTAKYNGSTDFAISSSDPTTPILQTINAATTTTTISAASGNSSPSSYGQSLSFTATVANSSTSVTPNGTVSFYNGSTKLATLNLVSGSATYTNSTLAIGSYSLTATYNGTPDFTTSATDPTAPILQTINPDNTTTDVTASLNPASFGQTITFTATVTNTAVAAITPTGKVTLLDVLNGVTTSLGIQSLVDGVAVFTTSALPLGSNAITATYSGATDFTTSSGTLLGGETVNPASTTTAVKSSLSQSSFGQTVTYTATVTASSGTFDNRGTVQFLVDGSNFGSPVALSGGMATIQESALAVGGHTITATYSGDTDFTGSTTTTSVSQTIDTDSTATTISAALANPSPSIYGQSLSFTATVANTSGTGLTPSGTVSFYNGSTKLATFNLVSGSATYTNADLPAGAYSLTATFNGSTDFTTSSSDPTTPVLQTIDTDSTTTTLTAATSNPNPSTYGQSLSFTATVANTSATGGTPTGSVSFYNGMTKIATVILVSGSATYTNATLTAGSYSLTAIYNGTTDFAISSSDPTTPILQTINPATTTTIISAASGNSSPSIYGQSLSFTATVANSSGTGQTPTGSVSFYNGTTKIATVSLVSGSATYTNSTLSAGSYSLTAIYNGSTDFVGSSSDPTTPILQTINAATTSTSVQSSVDPATLGESITFTVTVANSAGTGTTPTGTVTFQDTFNGVTTTLGTVNLTNGVATFTTSGLAKGTHTIAAVFNPSIDFVTSSESLNQTVS